MNHQNIINDLKAKGLFIEKAYVGGEWVESDKKIEVFNPATEEVIGYIPDTQPDKIVESIASAEEAQRHFELISKEERSKMLLNWFDNIIKHKEDLAKLITLENGKSLQESRSEVEYGASYLKWFAIEALKNHDYEIPANNLFQKRYVHYVPVGISAAITPWNFPLAMITRKTGAALAAGSVMIIKPSELTPFTALAMCKLALDAGIPKNVMQIVTGFPKNIGEILLSSFHVRKLSFTGSTLTGKNLAKASAETLKKLSMELGGSSALIINADAKIETALNMILNGKFRNNGQSCTGVNRIMVHESIYDTVIDKTIEMVSKLKIGDGLDESNYLGTVISEAALVRLQRAIKVAQEKGAKLLFGGNRIGDKGFFLQPTVFKDVTNEMDLVRNEIFGPVLSFIKFSTEEEAITMANNTEYGLASYICGSNNERNLAMAKRLNFGVVGINDTRISDAQIPFGGTKNSGFGREGGIEGIFEYLETRYIGQAL